MLRLLALVILLAMTAEARAQIVNVQNVLAKAPESDGLAGQVELKLDWRTGNNTLFDVGAAGSLIVKRGRFLGLVIARGEYGTSAIATFKRKTFEHARARVAIDCRWKWEAFVQHELDGFRRLTVRALAGTGPALQIFDEQGVSMLAGVAYMLEYERLDERMGAADAGERSVAHRASAYVTSAQKLGESATLVETVYFQPRIDEPSDYRVLGEIAVTSKLSKHVALTDGFVAAYDQTPPDGVKPYDTQLRIAVLVAF